MKNSILMKALDKIYPEEVKQLRYEWRERINIDEAAETLDEDDYIMTMLPERLRMKEEHFEDLDQKMRMDTIASKFRIRNNPDLWKKHYPTGFNLLDAAMDGGLTAGVHYIGAISSLGKSTLALQIADSMAANSHPVIYVSLEMKKIDLTAKLISMYTCRNNQEDIRLAKTSNMMMNKKVMENISDAEWKSIDKAASVVEKHGKNISVLESRKNPVSVDDIADYVGKYIDTYGKKPVVIVDYLQILSPPKHLRHFSDKQVVDYTVAKFRAVSATYNIPIIVISSFNRDNYSAKVNLQAFKESGNIEYSSDTLIGLQLKGVGEDGFDVDAAKSNYPRKIELVILKQRYGPIGFSINYDFHTRFNWFQEIEWEKVPADFNEESIFGKQEARQITLEDITEKKKTEEIM